MPYKKWVCRNLLTIFAKNSILDVWKRHKYTSIWLSRSDNYPCIQETVQNPLCSLEFMIFSLVGHDQIKNTYLQTQSTLTHYSPVLLFYTPWKHQKTLRFFYVFRGHRKTTPGCNGVKLTYLRPLFPITEKPVKEIKWLVSIGSIRYKYVKFQYLIFREYRNYLHRWY